MKKLLLLSALLIFACSSDSEGNEESDISGNTYFERVLNTKYQVENSPNYYVFTALTNQTDLTQEHYYLNPNGDCWLLEIYNGSFTQNGHIRYEVDYGYNYLNYSQLFDDGDISYVIFNYYSVISDNGDISYVLTSYDDNGNIISTIERDWNKIEELPTFNMCN